VIAAFRQLQTKARQIEQERADGIRERDDLRRQLDGNMRTQSFWRSQSDLQANDSFQTMRAATEQILATKRDLELQVLAASEKHMSHQRSNASDRALLVAIENELAEMKASIHVVQTQNRALEHELAATQGRCGRVAHTVDASPDARLKQVLTLIPH
jgi:chromosome segregation ATPase